MTQRTDIYDDEQWQLVPRQMTQDMYFALVRGLRIRHEDWTAVLAAAPKPPASAQNVDLVCTNCNGSGIGGGQMHVDDSGNSEYEPYKCDRCDGFGRTTPSAQSVEPVEFPREVMEWFNSYKSFVAATDAYNARLAVICARREEFGEFGSADPEYRAMNAAQCEAFRHVPLMFSALCRITTPPSAADVRDAVLEEAAQKFELSLLERNDRLRVGYVCDAIRALKSKKGA